MPHTVYILFSKNIGKYYTGQTNNNFQNRLAEHNAGETRSIKNGMPWELAWKTELPSRSEAVKLENKIIKRGAKRFLDDLSRGRLSKLFIQV
ncbi:MAG: GIY-YIG nuclease family protein [Bacteroidetes bacterium]|nr:GIY-YIG nuclease family protein [Bacteroidota bacterium]